MKIFWESDFPDIFPLTSIAKLKSHPLYQEAKNGNTEAAFYVIADVVKQQRVEEIKKRFPCCKLIPVLSSNHKGKTNKLPLALATLLAVSNNLPISTTIIQANSISHHTNASGLERLLDKPEFDGIVEKKLPYLLVDDVATSGATLAALRNYIIKNGGKVCGTTVAGISSFHSIGYGGYLALKPDIQEKMGKKFDTNELNKVLTNFQICNDYRELTNSQARYLLSYKSLEQLRKKCLAYRIEQSIKQFAPNMETIPKQAVFRKSKQT